MAPVYGVSVLFAWHCLYCRKTVVLVYDVSILFAGQCVSCRETAVPVYEISVLLSGTVFTVGRQWRRSTMSLSFSLVMCQL